MTSHKTLSRTLKAGVRIWPVALLVIAATGTQSEEQTAQAADPGSGSARPDSPVRNAPRAPNAPPNARRTEGAAPSPAGAGGHGGLDDRVATDVPAAESPTPLIGQDLEILKQLREDNRAEIAMGHAAEARGSTDAIRAFGHKLVVDHTAADGKIDSYLKAKKLDPSIFTAVKADPPAVHDLDEHTGQDFDRTFCQKMVDGHVEALNRIGKVRGRTTDPQLKALLGRLAPTLEKHLKAARALAKRATATAGDAKKS